jgi:PAT family beta-lactamase induction signal transducer AmpG
MKLRWKLFIVGVLYFAEGFPFGIIWDTLPVYFRTHGLSLQEIGLLSLLNIPWSFKFLWAPAVDCWSRYRYWMACAQFLMASAIVLLANLAPGSASVYLWICLMSLAFLAATQDIAIDAYSIELLETQEMGIANGIRVSTYRVALLVSGGLFVALGGWIGWRVAFNLAAACLGLCSLFSMSLPDTGSRKKRRYGHALVEPLRDLLNRPRAAQVLLLILLYKLGDMAMGPMVRPFWVDRGLSTTEIGFITGTVGIIASISGALLGGAFTSYFGVFHGLWFLGLWQAVSNLGYAAVARLPETGHWGIYAASIIESFCGGLGTAAFLAFLMSICNKRHAATQYALLSALFGITRSLSGSISGWSAAHLGYSSYFALTFLMALPAYTVIYAARGWIPTAAAQKNGAHLSR